MDEVRVLEAQVRAETVRRSVHGWQKGYDLSPCPLAMNTDSMQSAGLRTEAGAMISAMRPE